MIIEAPSRSIGLVRSWDGTERRHDWLSSPANVQAWLGAVGLPTGSIDESDLAAIGRLRRTIRKVIAPIAHGEHPPAKAVQSLSKELRHALSGQVIDPETLQWTWTAPATAVDLFRPVLLDAADIVTGTRSDRLKHCPSCDWLFSDRTRNGRRRWCDMADCGRRAKSRNYYHRTKDTPR